MTRGSPAGRPSGPVLFASAPREPRARRPTDVALALATSVGIVVTGVVSTVGRDLDRALADVLTSFPPFLDPLWLLATWAPILWAVVLLGIALLRHRRGLARDVAASVVLAVGIALLVAAATGADTWATVTRFADVDGPPAFPPGVVAVGAAAVSVAAPHLSRPFRHLGRWLLVVQVVGATMIGVGGPGGGMMGVLVGLLAAAAVHLVVGSPGGRPTASRIELALHQLGVDASGLDGGAVRRDGVARFHGADGAGPLDIKVYGRDAWDAQLMATLWRLAWYRGAAPRSARLTRVELVEHEAFMALLAERAGVRAPRVVTAGSAGRGDALVVVRPDGAPLDLDVAATDAGLDALWADLDRLHDAGIAHHHIDAERLVCRDDGSLGFGDLSSTTVAASSAERRQDQAQLLALGVVLVGEERAVAAARRRLDDAAVLDVLPYFQEAALPGTVRDAIAARDIDLDAVRNRLRVVLGADEQHLINLRRVTAGSILNLVLLVVAAVALIGAFGGMDLDSFVDALADASWWWLAFALLLAQVVRVFAAISTTGSLAASLPLGPLTALQFAICYVNLAIPSTAARVAINVRFFQRFGVPPATAMTAGVIDAVSGFVVQIALFVVLFVVSDVDLGLSADPSSLSGAATIALVIVAVLVVGGGAVVALVPSVRRRVVTVLRQARSALLVLRSPAKLVRLFGGNVLTQVGFALAFAVSAEAFGVRLPLTTFVLINTVVSLFAGLLPVPGGIGVTEAGLTLGLTTAGVASETAFAIALAYRFASFYLPPIWGWVCYRWLVRRHYL